MAAEHEKSPVYSYEKLVPFLTVRLRASIVLCCLLRRVTCSCTFRTSFR